MEKWQQHDSNFVAVDASVVDEKCNDLSLLSPPHGSADVGGRLLRLDSSVDMKLGDLGGAFDNLFTDDRVYEFKMPCIFMCECSAVNCCFCK